MAIVVLAVVLAAGYGAKKVGSVASAAESTVTTASSAGENIASNAASKGESVVSEGGRKFADFKAEDFRAGDDVTTQAEVAVQMLAEKHEKLTAANGTYQANMTLSGGSGRTEVTSPTELTMKDGGAITKIIWNGDKYDYIEVEGVRFTPGAQNGYPVFMVSVTELDRPLATVSDTTVMSAPHAIDYQLTSKLQK